MDKKPPSMVEFNFQDDKPIQEPLVLELNSDVEDDDFESYEDELIHIEEKEKPGDQDILPPMIKLDQSSILPEWEDDEYHDYDDTMIMLKEFKEDYPDLVYLSSIGKSILGRELC